MQKLGYLETITEIISDDVAIDVVIKTANEALFYQLAPYLFVTLSQEAPYSALPLPATKAGYRAFLELLEDEEVR